MFRINSDGATEDGHFKETPDPATQITAAWLNTVQSEIENVITNPLGGDTPLDVALADQLLGAILAIVGRAISSMVSVTAAATRQIAIGGIIIKWGGFRETITDEVSRSVTFNDPFPNNCWRVFPLTVVATAWDKQDLWVQLIGPSVTELGFSVQFQDDDSSDSRAAGFDWLAIGN